METTLILLLNETEGPKYKTKTASGHFDPRLSGISTQFSAPVLTRPGDDRREGGGDTAWVDILPNAQGVGGILGKI